MSETDAYRYEFSGWNNDITKPLTVDTVFAAQFTEIPKTYSVTLDPNGGTIDDGYDITEYTYGDAVALPDANHVTRDGFDFAGWRDENGRLVTKIPQYSVGDVEYTADWKEPMLTITDYPSIGESGKISAEINNNTDKAINGNAYIAVYSKDGALLSVSLENVVNLGVNERLNINSAFEHMAKDGDVIALYFWDKALKPLSAPKKIKIR